MYFNTPNLVVDRRKSNWWSWVGKKRHNTNHKYVSLTFDTVTHNDSSFALIVNLLEKFKCCGTFFAPTDYNNASVTNRNLLKNILTNGHELGNHGKTNSIHFIKSGNDLWKEIDDGYRHIYELEEEIQATHHHGYYSYRPVGGVWRWLGEMYHCTRRQNQNCLIGNIHPLDMILPFPYLNYLYVRFFLTHGDIVILHDLPWTPKMLEYLLPWMKENNYHVIPVRELCKWSF